MKRLFHYNYGILLAKKGDHTHINKLIVNYCCCCCCCCCCCRFQSVTRAYYRGAHGVILMYDVSREDSFIAVKTWINSIQVHVNTCRYMLIHAGTCMLLYCVYCKRLSCNIDVDNYMYRVHYYHQSLMLVLYCDCLLLIVHLFLFLLLIRIIWRSLHQHCC